MLQVMSAPDPVVKTIIGEQQIFDRNYRWSRYVISTPCEDGILHYNTLTCELVFVSDDRIFALEDREDLISKWFLVPEAYNEFLQAKKVKTIRQTLYRANSKEKWNDSVDLYWVLSTTDCNAQCFYCHEHGIPKMSMSLDTAAHVAGYIEQHSPDNNIHIVWYGGEPLMNSEVIDVISDELNSKGITYSSSMISNGFAFDSDMIRRACNLWHLEEVQITLDGKEQTYNRVKAYKNSSEGSPFLRVLDNISLLLEHNIKIQVRLNIDTYNMDELFELARMLITRFGTDELFYVYSAPLLEESLGTAYRRKSKQRKEVYEAHIRLCEFLASEGVLLRTSLPKVMRSEMRCIAVSNARVIYPDGQLAFCHDYSEGVLAGDIYSNEPAMSARLEYTKCLAEIARCSNCSKYPQCVRLTKCFKNKCNQEMIDEWIWWTKQEMRWEYEKLHEKSDRLSIGGRFMEIH